MRAWSWVLWSLTLGCDGESEEKPPPAIAICGDGVLDADEACDEGDSNSDEGECTRSCALATCGDGFLWAGREGCDEGPANSDQGTCTSACALASCGDGLLASGEACDQGELNDDASECTRSCVLASCGDGLVWADHEACDDANAFGGDGCGPSCVLPAQFLLSEADVVLYGEREMDGFGQNLLRAGDLNGDGVDDLVIAAPDAPGGAYSGEIYVFHGPLPEELTLQDADARLLGEGPEGFAGSGLASGDVNGDGIGDLVVSSPGYEGGTVYVVYGPIEGTLELADVAQVQGQPDGFGFGWETVVADLSGDGVDDLAMGDGGSSQLGTVFVMYGPIEGERTAAEAEVRLRGEQPSDGLGYTLATLDANGDGATDLALGAPLLSGGGAEYAGAAYLVFGPLVEDTDMSDADVKLVGENADDNLGSSLSNAGDLDGDGQEDLLVAAPFFDQAGQDRGIVYVLYGPLAPDLALEDVGDRILGSYPGEIIGWDLAEGGDANGDGFADVILGSGGLSTTAYGQGGAYVVYGPVQGAHELGLADLTLYGTTEGEYAGSPSAFAGDLDGDGDDELVLGTWNNDVNGYDAGAAYVVFGS